MIEQHEWEKITALIDEAISKAVTRAVIEAYRGLPMACTEIVSQKLVVAKLKDQFFKDNPSFDKHRDIVASVVTEIEGKSLGKSNYSEILKEAVPIITERIDLASTINLTTAKKPEKIAYMGEL